MALRSTPPPRNIARCISKIIYFILGNALGRICYPRSLFESRWFENISGEGWRWVCRGVWNQRIRRVNAGAKWPVSPYQRISNPANLSFHPDDINNFQMPGSYFQAIGRIAIGRGTYIAQNVGIITANHNLNDLDRHAEPQPVRIGERCWIGMNSVILPGVALGPHTIVGAGSVVTKSFAEGHCVIAGNPARIIRYLEA